MRFKNKKLLNPQKRKIKDLFCENCGAREATHLLYWERYYPESKETSLVNPSLLCDKCKELYEKKGTFKERSRLVPFDVIANKWDSRMMGLTSKSRWKYSVFRDPYFKKKIWRIRFACKPEKDSSDAKTIRS